MNAYESETPRFAFAVAAFALSALTIGTMVVAPAHFDEGFAPTDTVLAALPAELRPVEVAIVPARIEVVAMREPRVASTRDLHVVGTREPIIAGTREPNVAWAMGGPTQPNCKPDV